MLTKWCKDCWKFYWKYSTMKCNTMQYSTMTIEIQYNIIQYNTIHYWLQYLLQFIMNFNSNFRRFSSVSLHGTSNSYFVVNVWNPDPHSVLRSGGLYEGQGGLWGWKTYPNPRFCTYRSDGYRTPAYAWITMGRKTYLFISQKGVVLERCCENYFCSLR